jgi:hypothetical protein
MSEERNWRKSSESFSNTECVEVAGTLDAIRDSKAVSQELLVCGFPQLVGHIKNGKFVR